MLSFFGNIGRSARQLEDERLELSAKLRVEVKIPEAPSDASWFVVCGEDILETADSGEVLNVLVDAGFQRIHAVRKGKPDHSVLLFSGDVQRDLSLSRILIARPQ